jgi:hypothetical protein
MANILIVITPLNHFSAVLPIGRQDLPEFSNGAKMPGRDLIGPFFLGELWPDTV